MSSEALRKVVGVADAQAAKTPAKGSFEEMIQNFRGTIAAVLPRHLSADRMARIALAEFRRQPKLAKCDPHSIFAAIIVASQLGLEIGVMGEAYLVPYGGECQLIPGYQGLLDLVRRSGRIKRIEAQVVRDGDSFTYRAGLQTVLEHTPKLEGEPGAMRLAYAVAEFSDGGYHVEVMTKQQIEKIRDGSQGYKYAKQSGKDSPWIDNPDEMWRKTVIRRICKYLPKSPELATALALEDASSRGPQGLHSVREVVAGEWAPPAPPEEERVIEVETAPAKTNGKSKPAAAPDQPSGDQLFGAAGSTKGHVDLG